jgi:DNA-binding transcriptional MerR regulator
MGGEMANERESGQLYTMKELEELTGVPRRTIHFYVKEGLLPSPDGRGRLARYTEIHQLRLLLVELFKESTHLRLQGIREYIEPLSLDELRMEIRELGGRVGSEPDAGAGFVKASGHPDESEAVRGVMFDFNNSLELPADEVPQRTVSEREAPSFASPVMRRRIAGIDRQASPPATNDAGDAGTGEDIWHRARITDDLEIHYRGDTSEDRTRTIHKLIARARKLFRG